jgi:two-component system, response regulator, stage 0 sporulation protein F
MHNILVVDDEKNLQLLYKQELEENGYNVISTFSGEDALSIVNKLNIDLVILDIQLQGMNGLEALAEMLLRNRHLKVIVNTAYSGYKDNFYSWLADDYIIKSSDLSELKSAVRKYLH